MNDLAQKINGKTFAIVLLVVGMIVGGGIGYFAAPKTDTTDTTTVQTVSELPLKGQTVKIGYIAATTTNLETGKPQHEKMIAVDMNAQAQLLGWGGVTFEYLCDDANSQANTHLEKVQGLKSIGVTIFEGGNWSSMAQSALSYCNSNNMLMWATTATSPTLSITDDYLFRMCPSDAALAPALVDVMWSYGIKTVIIFQRGDSWGDGIVNLFAPAWTAKGGEITGEIIRYAAESSDFSNYLQQANGMAAEAIAKYGTTNKVGILLLCFDEGSVILTQAKDFNYFYDCIPFGGDGTAVTQRIMDDAAEQANHMKLYSLMAQTPDSSKFRSLQARYIALTQQQYTAYSAYSYDVGFVLMDSILQAQSVDATDVINLQIPIADNLFGASGWCQMNEFGDRAAPMFDVWFYAPGTNVACFSYLAGVYNPDTQTMSWNTGNLGFTPAGP
ncbi:MAG: ABC transporter substrate-binding protein [Candidatus Bathyarchaeota archaeon]|nr:ABC transporter substrate-binding protein [Candidatus Bathyarchaeota archaeon]